MGIQNIHILTDPDPPRETQVQVAHAHQKTLVNAHRRGEHTYGNMRRDCPLCQADK